MGCSSQWRSSSNCALLLACRLASPGAFRTWTKGLIFWKPSLWWMKTAHGERLKWLWSREFAFQAWQPDGRRVWHWVAATEHWVPLPMVPWGLTLPHGHHVLLIQNSWQQLSIGFSALKSSQHQQFCTWSHHHVYAICLMICDNTYHHRLICLIGWCLGHSHSACQIGELLRKAGASEWVLGPRRAGNRPWNRSHLELHNFATHGRKSCY